MAAYFSRFEEAERMYQDMDRRYGTWSHNWLTGFQFFYVSVTLKHWRQTLIHKGPKLKTVTKLRAKLDIY